MQIHCVLFCICVPQVSYHYSLQMAKRINQETFDDVVKENMVEFGMTAQEAVDDAIQQFQSQVYIINRLLLNTTNAIYHECIWQKTLGLNMW